jgi:hypothetical protein
MWCSVNGKWMFPIFRDAMMYCEAIETGFAILGVLLSLQ